MQLKTIQINIDMKQAIVGVIWNVSEYLGVSLGKYAPRVFGAMIESDPVEVKGSEMVIEYIITKKGYTYYPTEKKVQHPSRWRGLYRDVCYITELEDNGFQIDYYEWETGDLDADNQETNRRLILFPSGIDQVNYKKVSHEEKA